MAAPIVTRYEGEGAFQAIPRFVSGCDKEFVIGALYKLAEVEDRSLRSHRHYFASLADAWSNLPEQYAEQFPSVEHLRKFALIKSGFHESRQIVAKSNAQALELAAFVRPLDSYAVVTVADRVVTVFTALSQSVPAMGNKRFQESKTAVLDYAWGLVGMTPEQAAAHVGRAA